MRLPNTSPILDDNRAPMDPDNLSSTRAGVWKRPPRHFQTPVLYSLDGFQSAIIISTKTIKDKLSLESRFFKEMRRGGEHRRGEGSETFLERK